MSAFEFYINGSLVAQPKDWDGFEQEISRDFKKRFLRIAYPGTFTLTNASGYQTLRELFESDVCGIASFNAYETCGGQRYEVANGSIILTDCKWNLEACTVEVELQDIGIGARLDNNVRIPVSPLAPKSKNGFDITPCGMLDIEIFDPSDPEGTYLATTRGMVDWLDAIQHCVRYMTDSNVEVVSSWYSALPTDEQIAIVSGYQLRTGDTANDAIRLTYDFNELWLEMAKRFNLWITVLRNNAGDTYLAIEPEGDTFSDTQSFELLNQYELIQSVDVERTYSAVEVGDDDGIQNLDSSFSLPYLILQGFSKEKFHFTGVCNIDEVLDLTGKWYTDTNTIEKVVVTDPIEDDYDKDLFLIQYDSYLMAAAKGDYLNPGTTPYLYNQRMLNINILNRYTLPSQVGAFYDSSDNSFLASGFGPSLTSELQQPPTVNATFEYPMTLVVFDDDTTPPNSNPGGYWDIGTQRGTAATQGYYEFLSTMDWTLTLTNLSSLPLPPGWASCAMIAEWSRFDSGNVLISTFRSTPQGRLADGEYTDVSTFGTVMNAGDYITISWIRAVTRVLPFGNVRAIMNPREHTLGTTFIAEGGGELTSVDPLAARIITYEFDRLIPIGQWQELVNDPRNGLGVSHTNGNAKPCHITKAKRDSVKGKTSFTLITQRRNA